MDTQIKLQNFIRYWDAAHMVAFDEILSMDDLREARRFCACLNVGFMAFVNDDDLWHAINDARSEGAV